MDHRRYDGPRAFTRRRVKLPDDELARQQSAFVLRRRVCWHPSGHAVEYPAVGLVPEGDSLAAVRGWPARIVVDEP